MEEILIRIREQAKAESIRVTQHAQKEMVAEEITLDEVIAAIASSQILEDYAEHRRGPCCLLCGFTQAGRAIHVVCTTSQHILVIITVYLPVLPKWVSPTQRRKM
jgi:hypothetical protein